MRKLCLSIKFPHQEISWNYGILRSVLTYWCIISGSTLACIILQGDRTTFWNKIKYIQVHFQVDTRKILAYSSENLKYNLKNQVNRDRSHYVSYYLPKNISADYSDTYTMKNWLLQPTDSQLRAITQDIISY